MVGLSFSTEWENYAFIKSTVQGEFFDRYDLKKIPRPDTVISPHPNLISA